MPKKKRKVYRPSRLIPGLAMGGIGLGAATIATSAVGGETGGLSAVSRSFPTLGTIGGAGMVLGSTRKLQNEMEDAFKRKKERRKYHDME